MYKPRVDEYDRKIDSLYLKGIIAEKMLVYEDGNLRIGCIRSISTEWRQATLKLYIGNKSASQEIKGINFTKDIQFINVKDESRQPFSVDPNDQIEV